MIAVVTSLLGTRDWFQERQFFSGPVRERGWWFGDDSSTFTFTVHFISIIIASAPPQIIRH